MLWMRRGRGRYQICNEGRACTFQEAYERLAEQYNAVMPERVRRDPIKRRIVELEQAGKVTEALKMAEKLRAQE
jgi:hypothetical protein